MEKKFFIGVLALVSLLLLSCSNEANNFRYVYDETNMTAIVEGFKDVVSSESMKVVTIPSTCKNKSDGKVYPVVAIGCYAFSGCQELEKIILPNSIVQIQDYAFENCVNLREVVLQNKDNVDISACAFRFCDNLTNKSSFLPSEQIVDIHIKGFKPDFANQYAECRSFSCNMYSGGGYALKGGHDILTDKIVVPEGQQWAFKDCSTDYHCRDNYGWLTKPYIILHTRGRDKKYQLPSEGRDVVFYPGDVIRIGTYCAHGFFEQIDISVSFFITYM